MPVDYDTSKVRKCGVHGLLPIEEFKEAYAQLKSGKRYPVFRCKRCLLDYSKRKYRENPKRHHGYTNAWRRAHPERAREIVKTCYTGNKEKFLATAKVARLTKKERVLAHYSGGSMSCCLCPPEKAKVHVAMLALDHVVGGGTVHRDEVGTGNKFYNWIIREEYPEGYRVLCHNCNFREHLKKVSVAHADPSSPASKRWRYRTDLRMNVFIHYSEGEPKCACCGEKDLDILTIDHVDGGGRKQQRDMGIPGGSGLCQWLRSNGFPPGYQVLCHNCNFAKQILGGCPHRAVVAPEVQPTGA